LEAIRRELASAESPSPSHRRLWQRAMAAEVPYRDSSNYRVAIVAAVGMAALVVLAAGAWMAGLWRGGEQAPVAEGKKETETQQEPPATPQIEPQIVEERPDDESLRRIDELKSSLLALSEELEELSRSASLLEERKQVSQLLSDYEQL
jgi:hypothetical protein